MVREGGKLRIAIVLGSTRPGRLSESVARWVLEHAGRRGDADYELLDLKDYPLPPLDEPIPPSAGKYAGAHTRAWAAVIASFDAFVFVTPEYNHSLPGPLKNAIDYVYAEWNNKAAGFVSYGSSGGVRAVEQLRLVMAELQVATVRTQVPLLLAYDFDSLRQFRPNDNRLVQLGTLLDQLVSWGTALKGVRAAGP